jgi:hypothetical protein
MVEKLNDMLMHRYGKGLSIRRLAGIEQQLTSEVSLRGEDLHIPIFVKDIFLGYGLVHEARDLSFDDQSQVARLVRMILEPHLYSQHLERTINNIEIEKTSIYESNAPSTKGLFLFGTTPKIVQKAAMELHEFSENLCYLPLLDVASQIHSVQDLSSLENSTLVVDLEKNLPLVLQNILAEYLVLDKGGPLIIFTGSKAAVHFELESSLKDALKTLEFSVDRLPLEKSAMSDVLEMLYFKS